MAEWWIIQNVPKPVYIGLKKRSRFAGIIGLIVFLILIILSQFVSVVSPTIAAVLSFLAIFGGIIAGLISRLFGSLREQDIAFIRELLKILSKRMVLWSIPSNYVPVAIRLTNGVYVYIIYIRGKLVVLIGRPITHGKVYLGIEKPKIYRLKEVVLAGKTRYFNIDALLPYPDNPKIWYRMILRGFIKSIGRLEPKTIIDLSSKL